MTKVYHRVMVEIPAAFVGAENPFADIRRHLERNNLTPRGNVEWVDTNGAFITVMAFVEDKQCKNFKLKEC